MRGMPIFLSLKPSDHFAILRKSLEKSARCSVEALRPASTWVESNRCAHPGLEARQIGLRLAALYVTITIR